MYNYFYVSIIYVCYICYTHILQLWKHWFTTMLPNIGLFLCRGKHRVIFCIYTYTTYSQYTEFILIYTLYRVCER